MLAKELGTGKSDRPLFFPLIIELAVTVVSIGYGLLETLSFLHVHEKVHPAFLFLFPSQNASPASSLPCEGQVVFTDSSQSLPHSPASGQSHLYQWLHLEFRRFSKHAALDVSLACQTQQDWSRATWHVGGFQGPEWNSVHHSGHLSCLEPRHMGAPNAGKWSSWMPRREWHSAGRAAS